MGERVLSNARYAAMYNEFITYTPSTEPMTEKFIKQTMSAYQDGIRSEEINEVVAESDKFGDESCFFGVRVICATAHKVNGVRDLVELFEYIAYLQKLCQIGISAFSNDKLNPRGDKKALSISLSPESI